MFGLPDIVEERLERFCDAGGELRVRTHREAYWPHYEVFCEVDWAGKEAIGARWLRWQGEGNTLAAAISDVMRRGFR